MGLGYLLVLIFIAYAALKFYKTQKEIAKDLSNRGALQPGVSYYCNLSVTHRPQQIQAFQPTNPCQATEPGFAPAFGPNENMPCCNSFCMSLNQHVIRVYMPNAPAQEVSAPTLPSPKVVSCGFTAGQ